MLRAFARSPLSVLAHALRRKMFVNGYALITWKWALTKEVFLLTSCNEVNMKTELYGLKGCVSMGINTVSAWYMMRFKVFI